METLPAVRRRRLSPFPTTFFDNRISRLFGPELWRDVEEPFTWGPSIDLVDSDGELVLTAELPGMKEEEVDITINDGVLTLKGEKKQEKTRKGADYRISERSYGAFERSFTLPRSVDTERHQGTLRGWAPHGPLPQDATGPGTSHQDREEELGRRSETAPWRPAPVTCFATKPERRDPCWLETS